MKIIKKASIICLAVVMLLSFASCSFANIKTPETSTGSEVKTETEEERAAKAMKETPSGKAPGLYNTETDALKYSWEELVLRKLITVESNYVKGAVKYLNGNLYIPNGICGISKNAFSGCTGLSFVSTGNGVTTINSKAFYGCTNLVAVDLGTQITNIDSSVFACCTRLQQVIIPDSVTNIGASAFANCTGLSAAYIGNRVTNISKSAFSGCTGLTSVRMGKNITYIGSGVFKNCAVLSRVEYSGTAGNWGDIYVEKGNEYLVGASLTVDSKVTSKEFAPLATLKSESSKAPNKNEPAATTSSDDTAGLSVVGDNDISDSATELE